MKRKMLELFSIIDTGLEVIREIRSEIEDERDSPEIEKSVHRRLDEKFIEIERKLEYVIGDPRNRDALLYLAEKFDAKDNKFDADDFKSYIKDVLGYILNALLAPNRQGTMRMIENNTENLIALLRKKEKYLQPSALSNLYAIIDDLQRFIKNDKSLSKDELIYRLEFVKKNIK